MNYRGNCNNLFLRKECPIHTCISKGKAIYDTNTPLNPLLIEGTSAPPSKKRCLGCVLGQQNALIFSLVKGINVNRGWSIHHEKENYFDISCYLPALRT